MDNDWGTNWHLLLQINKYKKVVLLKGSLLIGWNSFRFNMTIIERLK